MLGLESQPRTGASPSNQNRVPVIYLHTSLLASSFYFLLLNNLQQKNTCFSNKKDTNRTDKQYKQKYDSLRTNDVHADNLRGYLRGIVKVIGLDVPLGRRSDHRVLDLTKPESELFGKVVQPSANGIIGARIGSK